MSRASRGISIIWVIFAVTLAGAAAITAFLQYLEVQTYKEWIKRAEEKRDAAEKERKFTAFPQIKAICHLCGWPFDQESEIESSIALLKDRVDAKKTQYALPGKAMAMWEIIHAANIKKETARYRLDTAKQGQKNAQLNAQMSSTVISDYTRIKDDEISALQTNLQKMTDLQTEDVRRYELRKSNLEAEDRKLVDARTAAEKQMKDELLDLANQYNRIETQLKELVKQEAVFFDLTVAQGKIVDPHQDEHYAFITLGQGDRLVRGLKFMVFVREAGGNVRWKGQVEVKDVYERSAKVSIVETADRMDPIINGDLIFNPLYNPRRPVKVAFAGDFAKTRYMKEAATARIRNIGSIVQDAVSDETDFVIVGESYQTDANYEKATGLSVPWRPAFEIFEFLGD
ncbi:MAG: hypothetical protein HYY18_19505 [Planctomycetes bacterium]|nr:hypothetical protein [Planctomycetota bacterium]